MRDEYSNRDERLQAVIDEINYHNQRALGINRTGQITDYPMFEQLDFPTIEGFGRYSHPEFKVVLKQTFEGMCRHLVNSKEVDLRKPDAKKNLNNHSTKARWEHRKARREMERLTKLLN